MPCRVDGNKVAGGLLMYSKGCAGMPYSGGKVNPKDTLWQSEPKKAMNTALVQGRWPRLCLLRCSSPIHIARREEEEQWAESEVG